MCSITTLTHLNLGLQHIYAHLWNDCDPGAQVLQSKTSYIYIVDYDGARGWLDDTKECKREGRLPCTGTTNYTNLEINSHN